jgi:hypothetical protein
MPPIEFAVNFPLMADSAIFGRVLCMHQFETIESVVSKLLVHHGREFDRAARPKTATNQQPSW